MDMRKKKMESCTNARLDPDAEWEEAAAGEGNASRDARAIGLPQPRIYEEKPVRIILIATTAAEPG